MLYFFVGQVFNQWSFVVNKVIERGFRLRSVLLLAFKRSLILYKPVEVLLYGVWLFSNLGWRRNIPNNFRYYKTPSDFFKRFIFLSILTGLISLKIYKNGGLQQLILNYSSWCFNLFSNPILTEKGYLPYAIIVSCTLVWLTLCILFFYFKSIRSVVKPYYRNIIVLNLVVFILLMSLFAKVGRAKFGIRVWYPSEHVYGERLGFEFWD